MKLNFLKAWKNGDYESKFIKTYGTSYTAASSDPAYDGIPIVTDDFP